MLYVDSDILFRRDVAPLFQEGVRGGVIAACHDHLVGTLGQEHMDCDALGLDPNKPYFNSGLQLIDVVRWRDERVAERTLEYLFAHGDTCPNWDQSALNVTLFDRWHCLGAEWNTFNLLMNKPSVPVDLATCNVHFVGPSKPWLFGGDEVPAGDAFARELAQTAFAEHRPGRLDRLMSRTVEWFDRAEDHGDRVLFHATSRWTGLADDQVRADVYEVCRMLREDEIQLEGLRIVDAKLEDLVVVDFT